MGGNFLPKELGWSMRVAKSYVTGLLMCFKEALATFELVKKCYCRTG